MKDDGLQVIYACDVMLEKIFIIVDTAAAAALAPYNSRSNPLLC